MGRAIPDIDVVGEGDGYLIRPAISKAVLSFRRNKAMPRSLTEYLDEAQNSARINLVKVTDDHRAFCDAIVKYPHMYCTPLSSYHTSKMSIYRQVGIWTQAHEKHPLSELNVVVRLKDRPSDLYLIGATRTFDEEIIRAKKVLMHKAAAFFYYNFGAKSHVTLATGTPDAFKLHEHWPKYVEVHRNIFYGKA